MFLVISVNVAIKPQSEKATYDYSPIVRSVDPNAIKEHVDYLASLGSRMTGYSGCNLAGEYIKEKFLEYGLEDVHFETFNVTVPVDYGSEITVLNLGGRTLKAYALLPNTVQTCSTPGMAGRLIYVEEGNLKNFNGKEVEGSIVLMEFNSGDKWINGAKLGAKAVIFIEPEYTTAQEAGMKTIDIPLNFPRFWISREEGLDLIDLTQKEEVTISIHSKIVYEIREGKNIFGTVKGTSSNESIAIIAHYDSYSIVPSLAPGAEDATGIAVLLELAKYFSQFTPSRDVTFIAFSGHWQALAGVTSYVDRHFNDLPNVRIHFELELSSEDTVLETVDRGNFYNYPTATLTGKPMGYVFNIYRFSGVLTLIWKDWSSEIKLFLSTNKTVENTWSPQTGQMDQYSLRAIYERLRPYCLDIEPINIAGVAGLCFRTEQSMRINGETPFDTPDKVNYDNLRLQAEFIFCVLHRLATDLMPGGMNLSLPSIEEQANSLARWKDVGGFSTLRGQIVKYNESTGWYDPVPNSLIYVRRVEFAGGRVVTAAGGEAIYTSRAASQYVGHTEMFTQAMVIQGDENGCFEFQGAIGYSGPQPTGERERNPAYNVEAYVINQTTGDIISAPDMGLLGQGKFPSSNILITKAVTEMTSVVFDCGTLVTYDLLHPVYRTEAYQIKIMKFPLQEEPAHFGFSSSIRPEVMFFLPPDEGVEILLIDVTKEPFGWIRNLTVSPEGGALKVGLGETVYLTQVPAKMAEALYEIDSERVQLLTNYKIYNIDVTQRQNDTLEHLERFQSALDAKQYDVAYSEAFDALAAESTAYKEIKGVMLDTFNGMIVVGLLLAPISVILENLLLSRRGPKKIVGIFTIYTLITLAAASAMVGFRLASNMYIVLLGEFVGSLTIPLILIIFGNTMKLLKEMRLRLIGTHFFESGGVASYSALYSLSVRNIKARRLRSVLTGTTLFIVVAAFTLFTSTSIKVYSKPSPIGNGLYDGIFVKNYGTAPLRWNDVQWLERFGEIAEVSPRFLWWPPYMSGLLVSENVSLPSRNTVSFIAFSSTDGKLLKIENTLKGGRWFFEGDIWSCIISEKLASKLKVQNGSEIKVFGLPPLKIVGIMDNAYVDSLIDLDQNPVCPPIEPTLPITGRGYAYAENMLIVPTELGKLLNFYISSVSISLKSPDPNLIQQIASNITTATNFDVYYSIEGKVYSNRQVTSYELSGWSQIAVPLVICMLIVANQTLGSVMERRREISILSSLGLSPKKVEYLFLMEILILSVTCGLLGYLGGINLSTVILNLGILPQGSISINASTSYAVYSVLLVIFAAVASSFYPLFLASKQVTPSLERTWKVPTKPKGNVWEVPMPLRVKERREALGLLRFIRDFSEGMSLDRSGPFMASEYSILEKEDKESDMITLSMKLKLSPYDQDVRQHMLLSGRAKKGEEYTFNIEVQRISGLIDVWRQLNEKRFLDAIRKQLLIWKGLNVDEKSKYIE